MPSTDGFTIIKGLTVFKKYQPKSLGNMLKIINTDTDDDTDARTSLHYSSRFFISNFKIF